MAGGNSSLNFKFFVKMLTNIEIFQVKPFSYSVLMTLCLLSVFSDRTKIDLDEDE